MVKIVISLLLAFFLIYIEARHNVLRFRSRIRIDKKKRNVFRLLMGTILAFLTYFYWIYALRYLFFLTCIFLIFFSPIIGKMWKNDWWYLNKTDFTDRILGMMPRWLRVAFSLLVILPSGFCVWQYDYVASLSSGFAEPGFLKMLIDNLYLLI